MKRCWIGLGLLIVLLAGSIAVTWRMGRCHEPMTEAVTQAAERALDGDWGNALSLTEKARASWEKSWGISAAFADHEPMEEINGLFAELEVYAKARDGTGYAAVCAQLRTALEAMGEAHGFVWWNLL